MAERTSTVSIELSAQQLKDGASKERKSETTLLKEKPAPARWRNLVAYWLLGLCNNYGYVVMLSAAHDILSTNFSKGFDTMSISDDADVSTTPVPSNSTRDCNQVSTGAILLADILPSLAIKLTAPFFPFRVHWRVGAVIALSVAGFLLVALATAEWIAILGVVSTSLASGLGEVTLLAYSLNFDKDVISTWSSGTGGAGVFGSLSYAVMTQAGMTPTNTLLVMLVVPALMGISFWAILEKPQPVSTSNHLDLNHEVNHDVNHDLNQSVDRTETAEVEQELTTFAEKLKEIPALFKYMIPLGLVYLFEYFINQGLFELIEFPNIWLTHHDQYRWLQVIYQIGVFISRSSVNIITIRHIWLMAVFQFVNVVLFTLEVVYFFVPSIWIVFVLVLWEGLLGGAAYVNTFYRMSQEVPIEKRQFSMGITSLADAIGIALAGMISIPVHNALCQLPLPNTFG